MLQNTVIHGDCVRVLHTIASESVDLVVTDPPYFVRYQDRLGRTIANDSDPDSVLGAFTDVYRVLKPNTFCISFYGWNSVARFFDAWTQAGFKAVGHIVWHKSYASRRGFLNARHEQAYLLAKGLPEKPQQPIDDVQPWEYTGNTVHPTQKAISILKPLIRSFSRPGDLVLDPFAGSGSSLVAAALLGRHYLGIELEAKYCELARGRLERVAGRSEGSKAAWRVPAEDGAVHQLLNSLRLMNCHDAADFAAGMLEQNDRL